MDPLRRRRRAVVLLLAASLLAGLSGCRTPTASRTLYAWTDAEGNVRYTPYPDGIPAARRESMHPVVRVREVPPAVESGPVAEDLSRTDDAAPPDAAPTPVAADSPRPATDEAAGSLAARIAALEARIAADQETLKALIADPERADDLRESPELREISERLPALQRALEALRAERDAAASDGT